jgi:hypothetical protein
MHPANTEKKLFSRLVINVGVKSLFCLTNYARQFQCLYNWHSVRHSPQASSYKCVYNSPNSGKSFIVFVPLDMGKTVIGMATKTAFAILLLCFVQVSQIFWFHRIRNKNHTFHTTVCACPHIVSAVILFRQLSETLHT